MPLSAFTPTIENSELGGLQYGESYTVAVTAIYTLSDAAGNTEVYSAVPQSSTCTISIAPHPAINLSSSNASSGPGNNTRKPNWYISTNLYLCGVSSYNWMFISVDPNTNQPIVSELPVVCNSGSSSRFIQLSSVNIPGLT
jgi:hypothetical protein